MSEPQKDAPKIPIPPKPADRAGTPKTDVIKAPLPDLFDDGEGVGEGTMKAAYVPTDVAAAQREAASLRAQAAVPEHLKDLVKGARKADVAGGSSGVKVRIGGGGETGGDTDKGGKAVGEDTDKSGAAKEAEEKEPPGSDTDK